MVGTIRVIRYWQPKLISALAFLTSGLILWTGIDMWWVPCQAGVGIDITSDLSCLPLIDNLIPWGVALGFWISGLFSWMRRQSAPVNSYFFLIAAALMTGLLSE